MSPLGYRLRGLFLERLSSIAFFASSLRVRDLDAPWMKNISVVFCDSLGLREEDFVLSEVIHYHLIFLERVEGSIC